MSRAELWICTGFNADLDPAFYLNADPNPESQNNAELCGSERLIESTNPGRLPGLHDDSRVGGDVLAQYTTRLRVLLHSEKLV